MQFYKIKCNSRNQLDTKNRKLIKYKLRMVSIATKCSLGSLVDVYNHLFFYQVTKNHFIQVHALVHYTHLLFVQGAASLTIKGALDLGQE